MKHKALLNQFDSFKNKQEKGLFTFYLQCQKFQNKLKSKSRRLISINQQKKQQTKDIQSININCIQDPSYQQYKRYQTLNSEKDHHSNSIYEKYHPKSSFKVICNQNLQSAKDMLNFRKKILQKQYQQHLQNSFKQNHRRAHSNLSKYGQQIITPKRYTKIQFPLDLQNNNIKKQQLKKQLIIKKSKRQNDKLKKSINANEQYFIKNRFNQSNNFQKTLQEIKGQQKTQKQKYKSVFLPIKKRKSRSYLKNKQQQKNQQYIKINNKQYIKISEKKKQQKLNNKNKTKKIRTNSALKIQDNDKSITEQQNKLIINNQLQDNAQHNYVFAGNKAPKSFLFNTLQKYIQRNYQQTNQSYLQKDIRQFFNKKSSNLLINNNSSIRSHLDLTESHSNLKTQDNLEYSLRNMKHKPSINKKASINYKRLQSQFSNVFIQQIKKSIKIKNQIKAPQNQKDSNLLQTRKRYKNLIKKIKQRYQTI